MLQPTKEKLFSTVVSLLASSFVKQTAGQQNFFFFFTLKKWTFSLYELYFNLDKAS